MLGCRSGSPIRLIAITRSAGSHSKALQAQRALKRSQRLYVRCAPIEGRSKLRPTGPSYPSLRRLESPGFILRQETFASAIPRRRTCRLKITSMAFSPSLSFWLDPLGLRENEGWCGPPNKCSLIALPLAKPQRTMKEYELEEETDMRTKIEFLRLAVAGFAAI